MPKVQKNICVFGIGGVGGYFGGKLAYCVSKMNIESEKIFFIARGQHLDEIKKSGLLLNTSSDGSMICKPEMAAVSISEIPAPDIVLLCVKSYDLDSAVKDLSKVVKDNTIILPLLNGVNIYERIRSELKKGIVLPACVYVGTHIEKPGIVSQKGGDGMIIFGKDPKYPDFYPEYLIELFDRTGIKYRWETDPFPAIWEKYIFIASFGLITAFSGKTLGEVMADSILKNKVREIMMEIIAIALKKGIKLPDSILDISLEKAGQFPFETKTSYQRDVESIGKRSEGDLFGETIIKMGVETGKPTPVTESVFEKL